MSKKSMILEQYQLLNEKLLTSEFTFGFELEGIIEYGSSLYDDCCDNYDYDEDDYDDDIEGYDPEYIRNKIDNLLMYGATESMNKGLQGSSSVHRDGSIDVTHTTQDIPFEYSSPIIPCTPNWFGKVVKLLMELKEIGVYTNDTCGFHTHLRFGSMDERDVVWIYCNLASDPDFFETFSQLDDIELFNRNYASYDSIRKLGNAIYVKDYQTISELLTTEKYRVIRIHPQGTLEWRGPRGFMDNDDLEYIKAYFKLLIKFINKISEYTSSNVIAGSSITKKELFDNLKQYTKDNTNGMEFIDGNNIKLRSKDRTNRIDRKTVDKLYDLFINKPKVFASMAIENPNKIEKVFRKFDFGKQQGLVHILMNTREILIMPFEKKQAMYTPIIRTLTPYKVLKMGLAQYLGEDNIMKIVDSTKDMSDVYFNTKLLYEALMLKSIRQIQEMLLKAIRNTQFPLYNFMTEFREYRGDDEISMANIIGEKNLAKLAIFLLSVIRYDKIKYSYIDNGDGLDYIKEIVKYYGLDKKWDDIVKDLILFDGKYYKLFINEQDMDTLLYSMNSYLGAYSVLSDEDKEKLRAYM